MSGANRRRVATGLDDARPPHLCRRVEEWPAVDQAAWRHGLEPGDPFDDPRPGSHLRPDTVELTRKGYGRWLAFLDEKGWLDPGRAPLARVTRPRLRRYFHTLREAGNADMTIIGRFKELERAMRILSPGKDVSWISRPDELSIYALLPKVTKPKPAPDSGVLFDWAMGMMKGAEATREPGWAGVYRDGLLLAMLASRARRLRSMALLRVGRELVEEEGRYRIELAPSQVKTNKPDSFDLPDALTPCVRLYLAEARPLLLKGRDEDALWINHRGEPWTAKGIAHRVWKLTKERFGFGFGPHRFRHAVATTAALRLSDDALAGAGVLGIKPGTVEEHYNRAGQVQAINALDRIVEGRKKALERGERPGRGRLRRG